MGKDEHWWGKTKSMGVSAGLAQGIALPKHVHMEKMMDVIFPEDLLEYISG